MSVRLSVDKLLHVKYTFRSYLHRYRRTRIGPTPSSNTRLRSSVVSQSSRVRIPLRPDFFFFFFQALFALFSLFYCGYGGLFSLV